MLENIKIAPVQKKALKVHAAARGLKLQELTAQIFAQWLANHPPVIEEQTFPTTKRK